MKLISKQFITIMALICMVGQASIAQAQQPVPQEKLTGLRRVAESLKATGWFLGSAALTYGVANFGVKTYKQIHKMINPAFIVGTKDYKPKAIKSAFATMLMCYVLYHTSQWGREALTKAYHGKEPAENIIENKVVNS